MCIRDSIYPTLSELCGLKPPAQIDGRSFNKVLLNPNSEFRHTALTQVCRPWFNNQAIEQMGYSFRAETYRYTQWVDFDSQEILAEEFYDIETDLLQRENLAPNLGADRLKQLRKVMTETREQAK